MPASIAPSTTSRPNCWAATSRTSNSTRAQRRVLCAVARWPCRITARSRCSPMTRGAAVSSSAAAMTASSEAIATNCAALSQEQRDGDDREQFPDSAGRHQIPPNLPSEHLVVMQDRQQRAERRGGQRQADRHEVTDVVESSDQSGYGADGQHRTDRPADHCHPAGLLAEQPRVELVACHQEQETQPDIGQQLDAASVPQAEHVRSDQDAGEDQYNDLRDLRARAGRPRWRAPGPRRSRPPSRVSRPLVFHLSGAASAQPGRHWPEAVGDALTGLGQPADADSSEAQREDLRSPHVALSSPVPQPLPGPVPGSAFSPAWQ